MYIVISIAWSPSICCDSRALLMMISWTMTLWDPKWFVLNLLILFRLVLKRLFLLFLLFLLDGHFTFLLAWQRELLETFSRWKPLIACNSKTLLIMVMQHEYHMMRNHWSTHFSKSCAHSANPFLSPGSLSLGISNCKQPHTNSENRMKCL